MRKNARIRLDLLASFYPFFMLLLLRLLKFLEAAVVGEVVIAEEILIGEPDLPW